MEEKGTDETDGLIDILNRMPMVSGFVEALAAKTRDTVSSLLVDKKLSSDMSPPLVFKSFLKSVRRLNLVLCKQ